MLTDPQPLPTIRHKCQFSFVVYLSLLFRKLPPIPHCCHSSLNLELFKWFFKNSSLLCPSSCCDFFFFFYFPHSLSLSLSLPDIIVSVVSRKASSFIDNSSRADEDSDGRCVIDAGSGWLERIQGLDTMPTEWLGVLLHICTNPLPPRQINILSLCLCFEQNFMKEGRVTHLYLHSVEAGRKETLMS
ncbi:unnamed protein product [Acanthosepion pharaonis]|uniref:Uncharacterized protein n=1 Tax=Acanthosepion pharaonis TaxID=158019 RepID=A0A812AY34_ACAPH|nr:unnamed protein product [Sepia pharaonis]